MPTDNFLSRSKKLIASMHWAALTALAEAPTGQLPRSGILVAIEAKVALDDWARQVYESGGVRWRSIFSFSSIALNKVGYVVKSKATWTITPEGRQVIQVPFDPQAYMKELDKRYQAWQAENLHRAGANHEVPSETDIDEPVESLTPPEEHMTAILREAHQGLKASLIDAVKACEPEFFERLVVQLLLKMGYGGSRQEAGKAVGKTGDGGIDGIINEDRLGLDAIYLQAKRWDGSVGAGPIRDFKGALDARHARKGVLMTTSSFTPAALEEARNSQTYKIVLIDGQRLAELMIEHDLGVSVTATYQLKRIDSDFFADD
jgi:restriction system protein